MSRAAARQVNFWIELGLLETAGTASSRVTAQVRGGCSRWWRTDEKRINSLRLASGKRAALKDILLLETRSSIPQPCGSLLRSAGCQKAAGLPRPPYEAPFCAPFTVCIGTSCRPVFWPLGQVLVWVMGMSGRGQLAFSDILHAIPLP